MEVYLQANDRFVVGQSERCAVISYLGGRGRRRAALELIRHYRGSSVVVGGGARELEDKSSMPVNNIPDGDLKRWRSVTVNY